MRVLALTPHPRDTSPGQRYRIEQWEPHLKSRGIDIVYAPFSSPELAEILYAPGERIAKLAGFASAYARQLDTARKANEFDLVYIFREAALIGPAAIESLIRRRNAAVVFDFDDAIFLRYRSPSNGYLSYLKFPSKTKTLCRLARHVMAGNDHLAAFAARYNGSVTVVPTTIDTDRYRPELREQRASPNGMPTIGWTGSHSTVRHLEAAVPALERLARTRPFRLVVIGAPPPRVEGARVEARPFRSSTEAQDLADLDVGIMPLPDDPWTRGKCGCKALQYMGLGIPTVLSPVGANADIVHHGENGLWARNDDEWVGALRRLIDDGELRARLGARGRKTVEEHYSARVVAPKVAALFESVALPARRAFPSLRGSSPTAPSE